MLISDLENGYNYNNANWAYHIKCILEECGLMYLWQNQFNMLIDYNIIKTRIMDTFYQSWSTDVHNSRRLETYCLFKNSFHFEPYLDYITDPKFRIALTRFRTSSHDLAIEKGRYLNIAREERICINCNTRLVENEFHFLCTCMKFTELRSKYIKRYYYTWPTLQKIINLLSGNSKKMIRNLAKCIYYACTKKLIFVSKRKISLFTFTKNTSSSVKFLEFMCMSTIVFVFAINVHCMFYAIKFEVEVEVDMCQCLTFYS